MTERNRRPRVRGAQGFLMSPMTDTVNVNVTPQVVIMSDVVCRFLLPSSG